MPTAKFLKQYESKEKEEKGEKLLIETRWMSSPLLDAKLAGAAFLNITGAADPPLASPMKTFV
jgi:hypothetical protein